MPGRDAAQVRPSREPIAKAAVTQASTQVKAETARGMATRSVTAAAGAGVDDVRTALGGAGGGHRQFVDSGRESPAAAAAEPGRRPGSTPTRHGRCVPGAPSSWTSPPPFTLTPVAPAAARWRATRSGRPSPSRSPSGRARPCSSS